MSMESVRPYVFDYDDGAVRVGPVADDGTVIRL
jgi:hypothetical protein